MIMTEHTKGEWIVDGCRIMSHGGDRVLIGDYGGEDTYTNLTESDMRLIAAAPDLLAALKLAVNALEEAEAILGGDYGDHYGPFCEQMLALHESARAAIAKAS